MKILYLNNPCSDFQNLENAVTLADKYDVRVLAAGGSFIGTPFLDKNEEIMQEERKRFSTANSIVRGISTVFGTQDKQTIESLMEDQGTSLIQLGDIYQSLKSAAKEEDADYITKQNYALTKNVVKTIAKASKTTPTRFIKSLEDQSPEIAARIANDYVELAQLAKTKLNEQYARVEEILKKAQAQGREVLIIPGGADAEFMFDNYPFLADSNAMWPITKPRVVMNGQERVDFSGQGYSPFTQIDVPTLFTGDYDSIESAQHFLATMPDVMLTNIPPLIAMSVEGKKGKETKFLGDELMKRYVEQSSPSVVLSGHIAFSQGVVVPMGDSYIVDPGHLIRARDGGKFAILDVDQDNLNSVDFYRIKSPKNCKEVKEGTIDTSGKKPIVRKAI